MNARRPAGELCGIFLTSSLYLLFENVLDAKLAFMIPAVLGWGGYVAGRLLRVDGQAQAWGFGGARRAAAWREAGAFLLVAVAGLLAWRLLHGWRPFPPGAWLVFVLYPIWALVQQFLLQALVADNLRRLGLGARSVVPLCALLFGLVHLPDVPLMILCAGAGLVWSVLYMRSRTLWPLALVHAWTGALVYYWVLERDPWAEMAARAAAP